MDWLNLQIAILKEIYIYGKESYRLRCERDAKERLKQKKFKHTFKAGKLIEK